MDLRQFARLLDHAGAVHTHRLGAHRPVDAVADGGIDVPRFAVLFGHQGRIGGDAVGHAHGHGFFDLLHIGRIDEKFHSCSPSAERLIAHGREQ